ncbi:MAG: hypothetical protein HGA38_03105 [Candidatus Moranbacteria bacterium]|nr:hypothetical protein [Candidatus Moranbacteria bacterium]
MPERIQITTPAIRKHLRSFSPEKAIVEYIWNGFDAGASRVAVVFEENSLRSGGYYQLKIRDNGSGIVYGQLKEKFKPYFDSRKEHDRTRSLPHGQNGYGRFTFIQFATSAQWNTVFSDEGLNKTYSILINQSKLEEYNAKEEEIRETSQETGTEVVFFGVEMESGFVLSELIPYIKEEFGWFLFLYPEKSISVGEMEICASSLRKDDVVKDYDTCSLVSNLGKKFEVEFVRWPAELRKEYSRIYFIDSKGNEQYKETTKLNKKGDSFFHSVYVRSSYFDNFSFSKVVSDEGKKQLNIDLEDKTKENMKSDDFIFLMEEITRFLREKRRPFVHELAIKVVKEYEERGVLKVPSDGASPIERARHSSIREALVELYEIEPRIFHNFNEEQKGTFVGLFGAVMESESGKDDILKIIDAALGLGIAERKEFAETLDRISLSGLLNVAKLIERRYVVYQQFKEIVFNKELKSYEKSVQKILEENLWILGEEYHLVAAEEDDFETALRNLIQFKEGRSAAKPKIEDENKRKQVDIMACRKMSDGEAVKHIVVEVKRPGIKLSQEHLSQVYRYLEVIHKEPRFNSSDSKWRFYLIGNIVDDFIKKQQNALQLHGDKDLVYIDTEIDYRVYALTWSQVFERFELRHNYLREEIQKKVPVSLVKIEE